MQIALSQPSAATTPVGMLAASVDRCGLLVCVPRTRLESPMAIVLFGGAEFDGDRNRGGGGWPVVVIGRPPVVRQQQFKVAVLRRWQALVHVLEIGPRIVPIQLCRFDQAEHHRGTLAGLLRTHE